MYWADIFVHMNLSLKALWPLLLVSRPFVVVHHGFYFSDSVRGCRDWRERLKLRLLSGANNIAVSQAIASRLPVESVVIPNPFDDSIFHRSGLTNGLELISVGRLVSEKGFNLLLLSLARLRELGLWPRLTIVGDGPERLPLESLVAHLGLGGQVAFAGACKPAQVAELLRGHRILVVPSLCEEGFGLVALEGAACGCVVLGSDGGGLPEAIGPAGLTFRRGDLADLTSKLSHLLLHQGEFKRFFRGASDHLLKHRPQHVASRYLSVFKNAAKAQGRIIDETFCA
jgi:glycosyltransferase involved in cell wall biosynthesis